jgi:hypothetical protein
VGGGGPVVMGLRWWLDVVVRRGNGGVVVVRWCGEDGAGLFIAGARSVQGEIFVLTGAPARSRRPTGIPTADDGIARAERQDGSGGDGTTRVEVAEGENISRRSGRGPAGRGAAAACPR